MDIILVIDDDQEMGRLLRTLFELEGYEVHVAAQYEDVMPSLAASCPDVVLLDVHLQGKETSGLMRQIRQDEQLSDIPVIMTSGMAIEDACLDAGATVFVPKPFLPSELTRVVKELLRK
jgi:CheY-like chemotaxis protein